MVQADKQRFVVPHAFLSYSSTLVMDARLIASCPWIFLQ
jgi:hypothetical protein